MKNLNELKTYNLENHTIYTVNGRITLAKSKISGKFINHVIAQMILNEHLKEQKLTYMILNTVTVLSVLFFIHRNMNKLKRSFSKLETNVLNKLTRLLGTTRFKAIDYIMLLLSVIDLVAYCKWIA
jgi:hypothetical protein